MGTISKNKNAEEQTQLSLLKEKVFTDDHSIIDVLKDYEEMYFDWMASDYASDKNARYRMLTTHQCIKDVLFSVAFNEVTSEVELIMKINI